MGKSTISMAIFNSKLLVNQRVYVSWLEATLMYSAKNPFKVEQDQGVTSQPSMFDHVWWYSALGTCKDLTIWSYQTQTSVNINQHNHDMGLSQNRGEIPQKLMAVIFFGIPQFQADPSPVFVGYIPIKSR